jgi:hypothetical protein
MVVSIGCFLPRLIFVIHNNHNNNNNNKPTTTLTSTTSKCDCYDISAHCCDRTIWRTHKFGTILIGDLFSEYRQKDSKFHVHTMPTPKNSDYNLPQTLDYRHVLVTRNWYDAIVSGYLYHRAGYECTIDYKGNETGHIQHHSKFFNLEQHYHLVDWDVQLTYTEYYTIPSRSNRSFCTYLQEESEENGIKMIIDFGLSRWYKGVVPYYNKVMKQQQQQQRLDDSVENNKTLFLCFEDLVDPFQQEDLFYNIMTFLFPGNNNATTAAANTTTTMTTAKRTAPWKLPGYIKASLEKQKRSNQTYNGSHASDHDPQLRQRLLQLVQKYDEQTFNYTIFKSNAIFGCGDDNKNKW